MSRKKLFNSVLTADSPEKDLLGIVLGLLVLHLWLRQTIWLYVAIGITISGALSPMLARWISLTWRKLTRLLGMVNSQVLLTLVYFLILTPLAGLHRLRRRDPLFLKHHADSYFQVLDQRFEGQDLEEMW